MNVFIAQPDYKKLSSMHFYGWKKGLKTGMYYLRTKPKVKADQVSILKRKKSTSTINTPVNKSNSTQVLACSRDNPDCLSCGS